MSLTYDIHESCLLYDIHDSRLLHNNQQVGHLAFIYVSHVSYMYPSAHLLNESCLLYVSHDSIHQQVGHLTFGTFSSWVCSTR